MNTIEEKLSTDELRLHNAEMFDQISPSYDRINHILSLGLDFYWRKKVSSFLPKSRPLHLLDGATGTCDQLISLMDHCPNIALGVGLDCSSQMLEIGKKKIFKKSYTTKVDLKEGSLLSIPYPDASFDCITVSFGIRNVLDVPACLKEIYRVLNKGGKLLILEFSLPSFSLLKKAHLFYLRHIVPKVGYFLSKHRYAYRYLNETIETFPHGDSFCHLLTSAGFKNVKAHPLSLGIVTIYQGEKIIGFD